MSYHNTFASQLTVNLYYPTFPLSKSEEEIPYQPQIIEARSIDSTGKEGYVKLIKKYFNRAVNYAKKFGEDTASKVENFLRGIRYRIIPTGGKGFYDDSEKVVILDSHSIHEDPEWADEIVGHEVGGHGLHAALGGYKKYIKNYGLKAWATIEAIATKLYERLSGKRSKSLYKELRMEKGAEEAEKEVGEYELLNPSYNNISYIKNLVYLGWLKSLFRVPISYTDKF